MTPSELLSAAYSDRAIDMRQDAIRLLKRDPKRIADAQLIESAAAIYDRLAREIVAP